MPRTALAASAGVRPRGPALSQLDRLVWLVYLLVFIASALEAYTLGPIPVQYVAALGVSAFVPFFLFGKYGRDTADSCAGSRRSSFGHSS